MKNSIIDELLKKRDLLQRISDISFRYSLINKNYPLKRLSPEDFKYVIKKYDELLEQIKSLANSIQYESKGNSIKNMDG
jgi:hypothetical protein